MGVIRDRWRIWERQQIIDELALTPTDLPSSLATDAEVAALASTNLTDSNLIARHKGVWTINTSWLTGDIVQVTSAVANGYPLGLWRCTTTHLGGTTFSGTSAGYWVRIAGDLDSVTASGAFVAKASAPGTNPLGDAVDIAAAVASLPTNGGELRLQRGTYNLTTGIGSGKNIRVTGEGRQATTIKASGGYAGALVTLDTNHSSVDNVLIDGNSTARGIDVLATRNVLDRVYVQNCTSGVRLNSSITTTNAKLVNVQAYACAIGFDIISPSPDSKFVNCTASLCTTYGVNVSSGNNMFVNLHAWGNAVGIRVRSDHNRFVNCYVETNTSYGYDVFSCNDTQIIGGSVWKNGASGINLDTVTRAKVIGITAYENTGAGVNLAASVSSDNTINGNHCYDAQGTKTQTYGIRVGSGVDATIIIGNTARDSDHITAGISLATGHTNTIVKGNNGLVADGTARKVSGTATIIPSATANTYGTAVTILPSTFALGMVPVRIATQSAGTFGSETLSVRATATFTDGTTQAVTKTYTSTGTFTEWTTSDFYSLSKDGVRIKQLVFEAQSTIANSTATASYFAAFTQT